METTSTYNLPSKSDFKKGGIFHQVKLDIKKPLPTEMMKFIFSDYIDMLFKQKPKPSKKTMDIIKDYCISTKKISNERRKDTKTKSCKRT